MPTLHLINMTRCTHLAGTMCKPLIFLLLLVYREKESLSVFSLPFYTPTQDMRRVNILADAVFEGHHEVVSVLSDQTSTHLELGFLANTSQCYLLERKRLHRLSFSFPLCPTSLSPSLFVPQLLGPHFFTTFLLTSPSRLFPVLSPSLPLPLPSLSLSFDAATFIRLQLAANGYNMQAAMENWSTLH